MCFSGAEGGGRAVAALVVVGCAAWVATACGGGEEPTSPSKPERPPNILLVIADDVGVDQVAAYREGAAPANTPNIDALAARGVLFRNVWANPVCSSTRATILTGRYGFRTGVGFVARWGAQLRDRETTVAELLVRHPTAPYGTAAFGKWHLAAGRAWESDAKIFSAPIRAGFSRFRGVFKNIVDSYTHWHEVAVSEVRVGEINAEHPRFNTRYNTSEIVDEAAAWIRGFEAERPDAPWFVWLAFNAAHQPFHKPPRSLHTVDLDAPSVSCENPPPFEQPQHLRPCYQAMIEAMDTELGRLLERELDPESLARTTVIFVGDNGSAKGAVLDPRLRGRMKGTPYEGGINVPLVVAGSGVEAAGGRESEVLVNTTDLFGAVLELAGMDAAGSVPSHFANGQPVVLDSIALLAVLASPDIAPAAHPRQFAYAELFKRGEPDPRWPVARAVRDAYGYKLIRFVEGVGREELYDLSRDPFEEHNLLGLGLDAAAAAALETLRTRLDTIGQSGWQPDGPPLAMRSIPVAQADQRSQ
ncbi:MAG: sulfatase-like hydrolase/transferase [bacterium]|nr:sulfatase-like hydrolase/transferase [bacterium]